MALAATGTVWQRGSSDSLASPSSALIGRGAGFPLLPTPRMLYLGVGLSARPPDLPPVLKAVL